MHDRTTAPVPPWWRFGHVWLVIAGPAIVVVAGFVTLWIAIATPDPVLTEGYYRRAQPSQQAAPQRPGRNLAPAEEGRNHAATPIAPPR